MSRAQILEHEFESNICSELGERGWLYQDDGDTDAAGWDEGLALVPGDVLHWLATQYPDEYEKAIPADLTGRPPGYRRTCATDPSDEGTGQDKPR